MKIFSLKNSTLANNYIDREGVFRQWCISYYVVNHALKVLTISDVRNSNGALSNVGG